MPGDIGSLVFVSADGDAVVSRFDITAQETTIGRGDTFKIAHKRVGREHVVVRVEGNDVAVKPVHVNPTFVFGSGGAEVRLPKDEWYSLRPNEVVAIAPNSEIAFRVEPSLAKAVVANSKTNASATAGNSKESAPATATARAHGDEQSDVHVPSPGGGGDLAVSDTVPLVKRKLPAWMTGGSASAGPQRAPTTATAKTKPPPAKKETKAETKVSSAGAGGPSAVPSAAPSVVPASGVARAAGKAPRKRSRKTKDSDDEDDGEDDEYESDFIDDRDADEIAAEARGRSRRKRTKRESRDGSDGSPGAPAAIVVNAVVATDSIDDNLVDIDMGDNDDAGGALPPPTHGPSGHPLQSQQQSQPQSQSHSQSQPVANRRNSAGAAGASPPPPQPPMAAPQSPVPNGQQQQQQQQPPAAPAGKPVCPYGMGCYRQNEDHQRDYEHPPGYNMF
eukprot:Opistho-2@75388